MNTTNPDTTNPAPRPLTQKEMAEAGGGAAYIKFDGIDGEVVSGGTWGTATRAGQFPYQASLRAA